MKIFLNKILNYKKEISVKDKSFLEIAKTTKVSMVFKAISDFRSGKVIRPIIKMEHY